ncbi:MAG TPA: protein kinase [Kofleriaceae bacterium]
MTKRHRTADLEPIELGGRYTLLRRLAIGGMAEIYLARQAAMAGFEKEVVIKRLRTELADDPRVVEMFLDEAKIGAQLNHPNIVHVYDVDEHDGIPYIAMEYIVGEELNELCRRGIAHDRFLPLEHAVELIRQAAAGMGYFHAKRSTGSEANVPLEIVHLDISPSNLLVTQDGFMKIIDFGIARAKGQAASRSDVLPGKLSYMSPEQAARGSIDHRSDIFSLGIVLYEITVGKRLFRGPAQEVVKRLADAHVEPPTFARKNYPPGLESVVMRALEQHPEDRYQSAYDLADDLETFLRDERLHSGPVRIARYLDLLAIAAGGARRPELISELEARREAGEDLDFDSQTFDGFAPAEGAPGPDQAAAWEDVEQPEAEIAAALHMELAELRARRTPVPTRPSGMMPVTGASASFDHEPVEEPTTTRVPRMKTAEIEGDEPEETSDFEPRTSDQKPAREPTPTVPTPRLASEVRSPKSEVPAIGSALLERSSRSRLWVLLVLLVLAAGGIAAYIVVK